MTGYFPHIFAVALGGAVGSVMRYGLSLMWPARGFPYATLTINLVGSFLMGFLLMVLTERVALDPALRAGLLAGVLGGLTTFSAFSMENVLLLERGQVTLAILYILCSVLGGLLAAWLGMVLARQF